MGVIKGKDIVDGSVSENKLSLAVQDKLNVVAKIQNVDLSTEGSTASATFDGITLRAINNGTFFQLEISSILPLSNCLLERTIHSGSGSGSSSVVVDITSTPQQVGTNLTTGSNPRVEVILSVPSIGHIYYLNAVANAAASGGWTHVNAYVERK